MVSKYLFIKKYQPIYSYFPICVSCFCDGVFTVRIFGVVILDVLLLSFLFTISPMNYTLQCQWYGGQQRLDILKVWLTRSVGGVEGSSGMIFWRCGRLEVWHSRGVADTPEVLRVTSPAASRWGNDVTGNNTWDAFPSFWGSRDVTSLDPATSSTPHPHILPIPHPPPLPHSPLFRYFLVCVACNKFAGHGQNTNILILSWFHYFLISISTFIILFHISTSSRTSPLSHSTSTSP